MLQLKGWNASTTFQMGIPVTILTYYPGQLQQWLSQSVKRFL